MNKIKLGLAGLLTVFLVGKTCLDRDMSHIVEPEISTYEMVHQGRPIKVTRLDAEEATNLKFEGVDDEGNEQTLYAFDRNKDGGVDYYGFGLLRTIESSAFYHLSDEEIYKYFTK